jgi:hypothetical protein
MSTTTATGVVCAGLVSVLVFPAVAMAMARPASESAEVT